MKNQFRSCGPERVALSSERMDYNDVVVTEQETVVLVVSFGILEDVEGRAETNQNVQFYLNT